MRSSNPIIFHFCVIDMRKIFWVLCWNTLASSSSPYYSTKYSAVSIFEKRVNNFDDYYVQVNIRKFSDKKNCVNHQLIFTHLSHEKRTQVNFSSNNFRVEKLNLLSLFHLEESDLKNKLHSCLQQA